jgi:hypothetical protein
LNGYVARVYDRSGVFCGTIAYGRTGWALDPARGPRPPAGSIVRTAAYARGLIRTAEITGAIPPGGFGSADPVTAGGSVVPGDAIGG